MAQGLVLAALEAPCLIWASNMDGEPLQGCILSRPDTQATEERDGRMVPIDLSGRAALVTGGSMGLGAATCERLADAGAAVVVNAFQHLDRAEAVVAGIRRRGGRAVAIQADVRDPAAVAEMVCRGETELGLPLTIVVNNVGHEERCAPPLELEWDDYQLMIDLNGRGVYNTCRAAVPAMRAAHWGRVVNILTMAFLQVGRNFAAYNAGKGAMYGLSRNLALELGADGITVNMVAPGWMDVARSAGAPPEARAALVRSTPLGRQGTALDVANAVLFYTSPLADFVTGTLLAVSGGHGMH